MGQRVCLASIEAEAVVGALELDDIQGIILRGYGSFVHVRHFIVAVADAGRARALIGNLTEPVSAAVNPARLAITSAAPWNVKPDYTLNLAFTYEGLEALGVSSELLGGFAPEFASGAVGNAKAIFDVDDSAPANWEGNMGIASKVHGIFSLFARTAHELESRTSELLAAISESFGLTHRHDGKALPDGYVHFGYRDGLSQPFLDGGPRPTRPYPDLVVNKDGSSPAGDFLLGFVNTFGNKYSPGVADTKLGRNGSLAAFRILKQDVAEFEEYLQAAAPKVGLTPDQLAAKFLGRWRSGQPLALCPAAPGSIPSDRLNMFLYKDAAPGQEAADPKGVACPIGAHIRRGNPRDEVVAGSFTQQARIMRRNVPYGPPFNPQKPDDGIERGLIGYFINADFLNQFQFLMSQWLNTDNFAGGMISGVDPLIGASSPSSSVFSIPTSPNPPPNKVSGFARFVITRGSAYCFLPSITGLRYVASARAG
jgi:deferrochelatase/peroxidase EfeB